MIPAWLRDHIIFWGMTHFERRPCDQVIGPADDPMLLRWMFLPDNRWFNIYWHRWMRSDEDRALHDHPWFSCAIILQGAYLDVTEHGVSKLIVGDCLSIINHRPRDRFHCFVGRSCRAGDIIWRGPRSAHRVELAGFTTRTLFIVGPKLRPWGFFCPTGWVRSELFHRRGGCPGA